MSSPLNGTEKYKQNVYFLWIQRFNSAFTYVSVCLQISVALSRVDYYNVAEVKNQKNCIRKENTLEEIIEGRIKKNYSVGYPRFQKKMETESKHICSIATFVLVYHFSPFIIYNPVILIHSYQNHEKVLHEPASWYLLSILKTCWVSHWTHLRHALKMSG